MVIKIYVRPQRKGTELSKFHRIPFTFGERKNKGGKPWWNKKCQDIVNKRKDTFIKYKLNPNSANLLEYKSIDALAKKTLKETKREKWRKYCMSLNKNTPIGKVWNSVNKFKNRRQGNRSNICLTDPWIEQFQDRLAPPYIVSPIYPEKLNNQKENDLTRNFDINELSRVLKNNNNSAPGKDSIHYSMLSRLPEGTKKILLDIFNKIYSRK